MTMPSKICVWDLPNEDGSRSRGFITSFSPDHPNTYIRADIADDLARAASKVTRSYWDETDGIISGMCELEDALARFRAITLDTQAPRL